jgi:nucleotide-binding universal stress UspA family protein
MLVEEASGDIWEDVEREHRTQLSERLAVAREKHPDVAVTEWVHRGDAVRVLVEQSAGAALTVVGSRGSGGFTGLLLGSVSHGVLHLADSPVAVVRA